MRLVAQHYHRGHRLCSAMARKSTASMALRFQWMEIDASAFTCCAHHALRGLLRLDEAHTHVNVKHPKA